VPPRLLLRRNCHPTVEQEGLGQQSSAIEVFCPKLTRDSEGVEAIVVDEVLDLVDASLARVYDARGFACAINGAAEVKTCDLFRNDGQLCSRRQ
jgi:hypothetical protein